MELLRGNRLEVIIGKRGKTDFLDQDIHFTVDKRLAVFPEINLSQQSEQFFHAENCFVMVLFGTGMNIFLHLPVDRRETDFLFR